MFSLRREWIPVGSQLRSAMAIWLILTVLCQPALPCGCARCDFDGGCSAAACECQECRGRHYHGEHQGSEIVSCDAADQPTDCSRIRDPENSCPGTPEATCHRLIVVVSEAGSSPQVSFGEVAVFEKRLFCSADITLRNFLPHAASGGIAPESLLLAGCARLQV